MKLILLRHGETEANKKEIIMGQTNDPLTERGIQQAKKAALRLKDEKIDKIYVSDLRRTMDTAKEVIAYHPDTEVIYEPLLREGNSGIYEGMPYGSMRQAADRAGISRHEFKPEGGESERDVLDRIKKFLSMITENEMDKTILVVTHGFIIANTIAHLFQVEGENTINFLPHNTAITIIELDFKTRHKILVLNCVKHLL